MTRSSDYSVQALREIGEHARLTAALGDFDAVRAGFAWILGSAAGHAGQPELRSLAYRWDSSDDIDVQSAEGRAVEKRLAGEHYARIEALGDYRLMDYLLPVIVAAVAAVVDQERDPETIGAMATHAAACAASLGADAVGLHVEVSKLFGDLYDRPPEADA